MVFKAWSRKMEYRPATQKEILDRFEDNVFVVPPASTPGDVVKYLGKKWPGYTLDLRDCVLIPSPPEEKLLHALKILPTDTEFIKWSDETGWNMQGNFWEIQNSEFNTAGSNLLKYAWLHSLQRRKKFLDRVCDNSGEVPFEPRFRYDAVRQDMPLRDDEKVYNVFDYVTLLKGGAKFYNEHVSGKHLDIEPVGENYWVAQVPSDKDPEKMYGTTISFVRGKQRTLRYFTGSCTCPDHSKKSARSHINSVCKHMVYAVAELACHIGNVKKIDEILPFPTFRAFELNDKLDWLLYPGGRRTDTSKDVVMRAYVDKHIDDPGSLFTTNPGYVSHLHRAYREIRV
ncbi:MAG: hypothetical protein U9P44_01420 [archaeon]|nr:hypothetical protein [archaeon]